MNCFCVYIILLENGEFYIGSTNNFQRRYKEHCKCDHSGTKYSKPIKVLLNQSFETLSIARRVEARLKKIRNRKILEKIIQSGSINIKLLGV